MKFWKKWPYWLRGGVMAGGVTSIWTLIFYLCGWVVNSFVCIIPLLFSPMYPIQILINRFQSILNFSPQLSFEANILITIIIWTVVGTVIGFLIDIKLKKYR